MKIPVILIKDNLDIKLKSDKYILDSNPKCYFQAMPYEKTIDLNDDTIYIIKKDELSGEIENKCLIVIGQPSEHIFDNNEVFYTTDCIDKYELFSKIALIFLHYNKWEEELNQVLKHSRSFNALFRVAREEFGNSMFMHDNDFYELACIDRTTKEASWGYDELSGKYYLPEEILNDFKVNKDYLFSMTTKGPSLFPATTFGYRIIYQNLWIEGEYKGRICINEVFRKFKDSDYFLLGFFTNIVIQGLEMPGYRLTSTQYSISRFLIGIIEDKNYGKMAMDSVLLKHGWTANDSYLCVCFFVNERDSHTHSVQYQCNRLESRFPHSCAFSYKDNIIMVLNITLAETTVTAFKSHIGVFLREGLVKAGISREFHNLNNIKYYYNQAICAFETGIKQQEAFWSYSFEDYVTDYILQNALEKFPAKMYVNEKILKLEEYDKNHSAGLFNTFKIYLENERNIAKTARELDIHRSTLLYRISKIEEITKLDIEDEQIRFELRLSFKLLEMERM